MAGGLGEFLQADLKILHFQGIGVDLVFLGNEDIVLQYEAIRQNIVVYETPSFDRGSTYSRIVRQYLDLYPYLTIQRQAYKKRIIDGKS